MGASMTRGEEDIRDPLQGIRVIDMTSMGMGPLAGQMLGDFGADVIKLEPTVGDVFRHNVPQKSHGMAHTVIQFNRNKRSLAIDLKSEAGMGALRRLVRTADVVLSNMRPQALAGIGLDYAMLREIKPDIIFARCYGYSERGPYAGRPAADDAIQAMSGLVGLQQMMTGKPQLVANVIADKVVGQALANAVLGAIVYRLRTGKGQENEVPMFETMTAFVMAEHVAGLAFEPPIGPPVYSRAVNPNRRPYATKDGYLVVLPYTTPQWNRFFRLIGRDDLAADPELQDPVVRSARYFEMYALIDAAMPARTTAEWSAALLENDIIFGVVNSPDDIFKDPHLNAMGMFPLVEHPTEGTLRLLGFPISYSETPQRLRHLPPRIGAHNHEILAELGYDAAEIRAMEEAGTIASR